MSGQFIRVTYRLETDGDIAALADKIASDQSTGTFTELPNETEAVRARCAARVEDIPLLFLRLLAEAAGRHRTVPPEVPPAAVAQLAARDWPGNVRELRNAADRYALGLGEGLITEDPPSRLAERVAEFERREIEAALAAHRGNLKPVYESLGLSRKTLWEKMQKYGLERAQFGSGAEGQGE